MFYSKNFEMIISVLQKLSFQNFWKLHVLIVQPKPQPQISEITNSVLGGQLPIVKRANNAASKPETTFIRAQNPEVPNPLPVAVTNSTITILTKPTATAITKEKPSEFGSNLDF